MVPGPEILDLLRVEENVPLVTVAHIDTADEAIAQLQVEGLHGAGEHALVGSAEAKVDCLWLATLYLHGEMNGVADAEARHVLFVNINVASVQVVKFRAADEAEALVFVHHFDSALVDNTLLEGAFVSASGAAWGLRGTVLHWRGGRDFNRRRHRRNVLSPRLGSFLRRHGAANFRAGGGRRPPFWNSSARLVGSASSRTRALNASRPKAAEVVCTRLPRAVEAHREGHIIVHRKVTDLALVNENICAVSLVRPWRSDEAIALSSVVTFDMALVPDSVRQRATRLRRCAGAPRCRGRPIDVGAARIDGLYLRRRLQGHPGCSSNTKFRRHEVVRLRLPAAVEQHSKHNGVADNEVTLLLVVQERVAAVHLEQCLTLDETKSLHLVVTLDGALVFMSVIYGLRRGDVVG
mmetsp:Transcript_101848/g.287325  ORF Transcript_101848/g.287325 Transcript_101848/m.287325 type:complete len:408 (-) Transcript_101848:238-1461(-)